MSNVGYDLDTSGGLMPLIRALIKPPDEDANAQKSKKPQHPYYKRPGKGHNHDSCDACGEGGDLICCDRCPASFHLGCYDPPLDENDIPTGLWLCKECRASDAEKPTSSRSSRAQSPADETRLLRNKKKSKEEEKEDVKEEVQKEKEKDLTPMEVLVKAAKIMNPRQFELPREMRVPCPFPGTDKEGSKNGNVSVVTVDASGCVPLPAKCCFVCSQTCKIAPLLQCDYCPLLFHQDCLDPPLTALPTGRWMCPNHVEQYIDWKMVNSVSATERVALWDQFTGPVDQHAIKIDFIRRARRAHPPFRLKVPVGVKGRVIVPEMVRHHYKHPPPLLPSRREYVRCRNALKTIQNPDDASESDDNAPAHTICLNATCPAYRGAGPCPSVDDLPDIHKSEKATDSDSLSDSDLEYLTRSVKRRKVSSGTRCSRGVGLRLEARGEAQAEQLLAAVAQQLQQLDDRLVKLLAWQRLQQVVAGGAGACGAGRAPLSPAAEALVVRSIDRARLARFGFKHVALPSELLTQIERERIARAVWGGARERSPPPPSSPGHSLSDCIVRATVCHVQRPAKNGLGDGLGRPIPMRLSRLTVGADSSCDVVLDASRCRHVSPRHATIFYDEVTRHFELINYSEWGSRVNGVLYACDATLAAPEPAPPAPIQRLLPRETEPPRMNGSLSVSHAAGGAGGADACACAPLGWGGGCAGAWEGAALVGHGALLQFGDHMFVFSVTEPHAFAGQEPNHEPAL